MIIGILQCDDVTEELQQSYGNYPQMFTQLFAALEKDLKFNVYCVTEGQYPLSIHECDAYILTGSRFGVNDVHEWISKLEGFVLELYQANKKLIGICFGHQMIVKALGGVVETSSKGWGLGVSTTQVKVVQQWMHQGQNEISLVVSHQDQVKLLPQGSKILASSDFCPFYMIQINGHFLGIQGHPEFSKDYSYDFMQAKRASIPRKCIQAGIASLASNIDDRLVARWLINFIKQAI
ncbi:GMP synthase [Shewanella violacea]|uniref:Glutamine amidotransferase class-I domain protein n=1 Tax=Shewanella violacea (strain JCM 10179 / CIP 106290 / LMG 19151 / DSS12) TaxID=637905 RepID=D4ZL99_SHEVD|nr:GMP synthase [Shewanella violacea]BAJ02448.1 glutamine amidotransferase class-I domain protein [Shewanella violacea DSS12]